MTGTSWAEVDFIEELRLRRWARENYIAAEGRDATWHPIVHDEMNRKDGDTEIVSAGELALATADR